MRRSPLLPIFLIVLVDVLGFTIVIPLLAIYAERFGASAFTATLLVPTYAVCQLVAGPILGGLSDRFGRRKILVISQLGTLVGFIMLANAAALWMVFIGRLIDGVTAGNITIAQAYISDNTPPEKRARSFALIGISFGIGFMIGPAMSGWLSQYSLATPFWVAAAMSATSILGTIFLLPPDAPPKGSLVGDKPGEASANPGPGGKRLGILDWGAYVDYFRRPALGGLLWQFFVYMFAFSMFTGGFALFAERAFTWHGHAFRPREIGFVFALSGLVGAFIQGGMIGRLVKKYGEGRLAAIGFFLFGLGYFILGVEGTITVLVVSTIAAAAGNAVLRPTLTALITHRADRREQGVVLGLTQSLSSVAAIIAPPLSGFLIGHHLGRTWAWVTAGAAFVGLLMSPIGSGRHAPPTNVKDNSDGNSLPKMTAHVVTSAAKTEADTDSSS